MARVVRGLPRTDPSVAAAFAALGTATTHEAQDRTGLLSPHFPVWSKTISAQGTVKETLANVQVSLICGGRLVSPGDVIVADDDGVCVVRRMVAETVLSAAQSRAAVEDGKRALYASGQLSLDVSPDLRRGLDKKGLIYEQV